MFVRAKRSVGANGATYQYLQIVRSVREGRRVRQRVVGTLGRKDALLASGELDGLVKSLASFSDMLSVVEKAKAEGLHARSSRSWGPALVFERLWERQGVPEVLRGLAKGRRFQFDVERCVFAMALQRLMAPGSDLQASSWIRTVEVEGFSDLALHHFYRTASFLCGVRHELEERLFARDTDLFTRQLDVVFLDTTSTYVYRNSETPYRKWGYSRDRRGDLPQLVLCVVVDGNGWPIAWEILPGNTADKAAFREVVARLREKFSIRSVVVVADRGMISKDSVEFLTGHETAPFDYVLGCRLRQQKEVREDVLLQQGPLEAVSDNLAVRDVFVGDRRYVLCRNEIEARADAAARVALVEKLERTLKESGPKAMVSNRGFSRFLRIAKGSVSLDAQAVAADTRFDGVFVLTTNTNASAADVALRYKSLWRVERVFRETKSTIDMRPIFHHSDTNSIGHIVACFLALRLEVDLQRRLDEKKVDVPWPDLMLDLGQVHAVDVELHGERYRLRTDLVRHAHHAFSAAGVRPPPSAAHRGPVPPATVAPEAEM